MENDKKRPNGMAYRFMRLEIQRLIVKLLKKADIEMRDIYFKKLSSKLQYDYGVGALTVNRLIVNMQELGIVTIDNDGIIKQVIQKNGNP